MDLRVTWRLFRGLFVWANMFKNSTCRVPTRFRVGYKYWDKTPAVVAVAANLRCRIRALLLCVNEQGPLWDHYVFSQWRVMDSSVQHQLLPLYAHTVVVGFTLNSLGGDEWVEYRRVLRAHQNSGETQLRFGPCLTGRSWEPGKAVWGLCSGVGCQSHFAFSLEAVSSSKCFI